MTSSPYLPSLSPRNKFFYAAGNFGVGLITYVVMTWVVYLYEGMQGPTPSRAGGSLAGLLSLALLVGRVVDGAADILVGYWSDRTATRWGRRKPFIGLGILPMLVLFFLVWVPPAEKGPRFSYLYLTAIYSGFLLFYTIVVCPYLSLLPEIATTSAERISLARWQGTCNLVGLAAGAGLVPFLIKGLGYRDMALIVSSIALVAFLLPLFGEKEKPADRSKPPLMLGAALKQTFANPHFRSYCGAYLCFWGGLQVLAAATPYIATYVVHNGAAGAAPLLGMAFLSGFLFMPLISELALATGKRGAFLVSTGVFAVTASLLGTVGLWPLAISPLVQALVIMFLAGPAVAGLFTLPNAILADITTYDAQITGRRREAIYFGVQGLVVKISIGLSAALIAFMLATFRSLGEGFGGIELGTRLTAPVAGLAAFGSFLLFRRYRLSEAEPARGPLGVKEADAVVLAGGRKDTTPILGKPSVERVVEALKATPQIKNIVVVGPQKLTELPGLAGVKIVPEGANEAAKLFSGIEALGANRKTLLLTGDSPLLEGEILKEVLDNCEQDSEICYPFVKCQEVKRAFPERKWVSLRLAEGEFTGSTLAIIEPKAVLKIRPFVEDLLGVRRHKWRAVLTLGPLFFIMMLTGRARLAYIERKAEKLLGLRCQGLPTSHPQLAMDTDRPEDVRWVEEYLLKTGGIEKGEGKAAS